jgi:hypothetical protein
MTMRAAAGSDVIGPGAGDESGKRTNPRNSKGARLGCNELDSALSEAFHGTKLAHTGLKNRGFFDENPRGR